MQKIPGFVKEFSEFTVLCTLFFEDITVEASIPKVLFKKMFLCYGTCFNLIVGSRTECVRVEPRHKDKKCIRSKIDLLGLIDKNKPLEKNDI